MEERDEIENNGEDLLQKEDYVNDNLNYINNINHLNSQGNKLLSIDSLIEVKDENKLRSMNSLLKGIYDDYDNTSSFLSTEEEDVEANTAKARVIYNIKDYTLIFFLLISSSLNFSILYFPYIIFSFLLSLSKASYNKRIYKFKKLSELIILIYSFLLLIFKIVIIILIKKDNDWTKEEKNKNILINLGIKLLIDTESIFNLISSFIGECIVIIISLISLIVSNSFFDYDLNDNPSSKITTRKLFNLLFKHLIINYFILLGLAFFNTSIAPLAYLVIMSILLIFVSIHSELKLISFCYKIISIIIYAVVIIQIFLINLMNIYHFIDALKPGEGNKYSRFTIIGIKYMNNNSNDYSDIFIQWLSYFFLVLSMISLSHSNNKLSFDLIYSGISRNLREKEEEIMEEAYKYESYNIFFKILIQIKNYFVSPNFVLHICRLLAIEYLYYFRNFFGIIVFIWLFFSFLFLYPHSNQVLTYILLCNLLVGFICFHIANVDGLIENIDDIEDKLKIKAYHVFFYRIPSDGGSNDEGKYYEKNYYIFYISLNLFYFFLSLFFFSLYESQEKKIIKEKIESNKKYKEDYQENIDLGENLIEKQDKDAGIITTENKEEDNINTDSNDNNIENKNTDDINTDSNKTDDKNNTDNINTDDSNNEEENKKRRATEQILNKENDEDIPDDKNNKQDKELLKKLTFINIITKAFFSHIDKISLVVMYFVAIYSVNIIHSILVIIFMIQLLFPGAIGIISIYLIIITQLLFLSEFVFEILRHYFNRSLDEKLIRLIMGNEEEKESKIESENNYIEVFIYAIVYCFYFQYKLYNNDFYQTIVSNDNLNLSKYIEIKFASYPIIRKTLDYIGKIIIEIYIWTLISLFIFFDSYFEISILFEIKLILFLIIVFQFLISIQKSESHHISLILNWIFLIYCSLNTILVYGYQIICLDYFDIKESDNYLRENLPSIGFSDYKGNYLYYKFMPHFVCNFISVLYIWEMKRISLNSNKIDKIENKILDKDKDENKKKKNDNGEENDEDEITASEQYEKNKNEMNFLSLTYSIYNIILILTKFYWLFLFLSICIIFTSYDLSFIMTSYILIFGITFVRMFYQIITKLSNFISKKSFFISRLLRYNLIEQNRHVIQNKYYRSLAFKYLLCMSFFSYLLFYTFGIFYLFQNGCNKDQYGGCDTRHQKMIEKEGDGLTEEFVQSLAYLIGFYVNPNEDPVIKEGWYHLFFAILICFDVYVQKIEHYFNKKVEENRKRFKHLANENTKLKPLTYGEDNILMNIGYEVKKVQENMENEKMMDQVIQTSKSKTIKEKGKDNEEVEDIKKRLRASRKKKEIMAEEPLLQFNIDTKDKQEEERIGSKLIEAFLKIFDKAANSIEVKLSSTNSKYQIIKILKKIFEEIIIFLLICIAISKMNIWSFIYMTISLRLIVTEKTMMKYYRLYCFMIVSILNQSIIFVSNINKNTDPYPDEEELEIMNRKFNIPWYKKKYNLDEKYGFFYGLGVSHSQINLIWMEFIEVIIIYIYLDYFSYSIYQESNTIGRSKDKTNKINYYNLYLNKEIRNIGKKLPPNEYEKHRICMKYNFDIDILKYDKFIYYMKHGKIKSDNKNIIDDKSKKNALEAIPEVPEQNLINEDDKGKIEKIENEEEESNSIKALENIGDEKNKMISPLLNALSRSKQLTSHTNLMEKSKNKTKDNKCMSLFKDFIYLSFHNVILIIIIIISMMISGFISIFYIAFSLYFLITSTSIYLGSKYYYPRAIKKLLRITILLDITIQILYQAPFFSDSTNEVLENIGLNKILTFKKDDITQEMEVELSFEYLILVLAKAFTYLFMSFQILVYSSQSFQEYYLSYIISKNDILRRISLMNVFKFNNERIEVMNNSINLRNDMSQSMDILKSKLELWNTNLMMAKGDVKNTKKEDNKNNEDSKKNDIGISLINMLNNVKNETKEEKKEEEKKEEHKKDEEKEKEEKEKEEKEKEEKEKEEKEKEEKEKEEKEKKEKEEKEKQEREKEKEASINISKGFFGSLGLPIYPIVKKEEENEEEDEEEENKNKPLPEKEVYDKIKGWILGGFLIKFQLMLHKYASNYTTIEKNEIDLYEKDIIQGKTKITSFIENMVDMQLNTLDLSNFTSAEMKEVKTYFDGTRAKKLAELKKDREKKKVFQNVGKKLIFLNKLNKDMKNNNEDKFENLDIIKKRADTFRIKNKGVLAEVKKQKEKDQKKMIDLNQPKFKKLDKFISGKLFIKYLSKSYIIQSILKTILSFCSNNFHWLCYLMMIINHMMSSSLLTILYPLSIFCYAILEYPRPKKFYWTFCLIYTVILLSIKFIVNLKIFKNTSLKETLDDLYDYKVGFKVYESNFSSEFFMYILYDALVLTFLLINDYLLVSKGIWNKREQEIENIYQAMERVAKTKDLEFNTSEEIKKFNSKYLNPYKSDKIEISEKETFRFSKYLNVDDYNKRSKSVYKNIRNSKKGISLKKSKLKTSVGLLKGKSLDDNNISYNRKEKTSIRKDESKEKKKKEDKKEGENKNEEFEEEIKYDESKRKYFEKLFPTARNEKPGSEYYASYAISMLFIIIIILLFYTRMVQDKTYGNVEIDTKQFSGEMVIALLIHVFILVYDRILYISQNRNNLKYEYYLYDKETQNPLTDDEFNKIKKDIEKEYPDMKKDKFKIPPDYADKKLKERYNIIIIQYEEKNLPLIQKYILHLSVVIFGHIFIFFYCPFKGNWNMCTQLTCSNTNLEGEESQSNDFLKNFALILVYIFYVVYLTSSGLQVKYGFYDMKRKSMLKSGNSSINGTIYTSYKAIPFLYEIKLAIDWTFTKTCLDLFQWNKFESVYDIVYCTYCAMTAKNQQLVGQKVGKVLKICMGGLLSFALVFILVAPLMLFSSLNPTNQLNNLTGATLRVDLGFFYKNGAIKNYTLFENSKPESIEDIFKSNDWINYNYTNSSKTKNFPKGQIQSVQFFNESDKNWDLARPHIENLRDLIINRRTVNDLEYIGLILDYNFDRPLPAESMKISKRYSTTIYYYSNHTKEQDETLDKIGDALKYCKDVEVVFPSIYSPPIRLSATIKPKRLQDPKFFPNLDIVVGFVGCRNESINQTNHTNDFIYEELFKDEVVYNKKPSYLESYFTVKKILRFKDPNETEIDGIKFHVFSDKVSTTTSGKNILTFYVSFVLLVGTYVRNFFAGQPEKIMLTEMPHSEEIINLCEGIKVSRYSFDFEQEEKLYYILIELMRSPDYLRTLTQSSTEQFKQRQELTRVYKTSDDI